MVLHQAVCIEVLPANASLLQAYSQATSAPADEDQSDLNLPGCGALTTG